MRLTSWRCGNTWRQASRVARVVEVQVAHDVEVFHPSLLSTTIAIPGDVRCGLSLEAEAATFCELLLPCVLELLAASFDFCCGRVVGEWGRERVHLTVGSPRACHVDVDGRQKDFERKIGRIRVRLLF